jgi:hypothetical protein
MPMPLRQTISYLSSRRIVEMSTALANGTAAQFRTLYQHLGFTELDDTMALVLAVSILGAVLHMLQCLVALRAQQRHARKHARRQSKKPLLMRRREAAEKFHSKDRRKTNQVDHKSSRRRRSASRKIPYGTFVFFAFATVAFVVVPVVSATATAGASATADYLNRGGPKAGRGRSPQQLLRAPARKGAAAPSNGFAAQQGDPPEPRAVQRSTPRPPPPQQQLRDDGEYSPLEESPPPRLLSDAATAAVAAPSTTALVTEAATAPTSEAAKAAQEIARGFMTMTSRRLTTTVFTEAGLSAAIANNANIVLGADITLSAGGSTASAFTISGVTGLTIDGAGHTLGFSSSSNKDGRIFYIDSASEVEMVDLTLENGYVYSTSSSVYGGAIYITGSSTLKMTSCTLSGNKVYTSVSCICIYVSLVVNLLWLVFVNVLNESKGVGRARPNAGSLNLMVLVKIFKSWSVAREYC